MNSFFTDIKSFFGTDYHGRYLGIILQEISRRHPDPLITFICQACKIPVRDLKGSRFEAEYGFECESGKRRADLAVFRKNELDPTLLIEIKYFDKPTLETDTKPAQLYDYMEWKNSRKKGGRFVLILSRESLLKSGIVSKRWGQLAQHLSQHSNKSDLIKMLVEFLEDEGIVMQKIDGKLLQDFFKRLLCGYKGTGPIVNSIKATEEFANILQNMRNLSIPLERYFKDAWSEAAGKASKKPIIDFEITNRLKSKDSKKIFDLDDDLAVKPSVKNGGQVSIFARHSLGNARITYGIYFEISLSSQPKTFIFAQAHGSAWRTGEEIPYYEKDVSFDLVTEKAGNSSTSDKIEEILIVLMSEVIKELLDKNTKTRLTEHQQDAIKKLSQSIKVRANE